MLNLHLILVGRIGYENGDRLEAYYEWGFHRKAGTERFLSFLYSAVNNLG